MTHRKVSTAGISPVGSKPPLGWLFGSLWAGFSREAKSSPPAPAERRGNPVMALKVGFALRHAQDAGGYPKIRQCMELFCVPAPIAGEIARRRRFRADGHLWRF